MQSGAEFLWLAEFEEDVPQSLLLNGVKGFSEPIKNMYSG